MSPQAKAETSREQIRKDHPDSWIAVEPGDHLTGTVTDVTEAWSDVRQDGSYYPLLTIGKITEAPGYELAEGLELKLHAFGAVLYNEIMRHEPEVGERITVTYQGTSGKEPPKGRNAPELYRVRVHDRTDQASRAYGRIRGEQGDRQPQSREASDGNGDIPF